MSCPRGVPSRLLYMYSTLITNLHAKLPFDELTIGVLHVFNVAHTQLHYNVATVLKAFHIVCELLNFKSSPQVLLYYYSTRHNDPVNLLSLFDQPKFCLFSHYTSYQYLISSK